MQFIPLADYRIRKNGIKTTAADAAKLFGEGLKVIVPRRLPPLVITRIYLPRQTVGWRFSPESKGKPPFCGCQYCNRGQINAYRVKG